MSNQYFQFKQFNVMQDKCAMKVGTDGVLLGAWADTKSVSSILDIGTGTGLIALMLAQRSNAIIDAIEIDEAAAIQASENSKQSPWPSRINVICDSFQNYIKAGRKYDLIVSNPPYFINSLSTPNEKRTIARHSHQLTTSELVVGVTSLLNQTGRFAIILPTQEAEIFRRMAQLNSFFENRRLLIYPSPGKKVKRILSEYSFNNSEIQESALIIEKYGRHKYSEEYIALTKDYYLNF